jgi:small conductance mechanosensitive channel
MVTNRSRGWNRAVADVTISPEQDAERALEVCRKVVSEFNADKPWRDRLLDPAEVWGIESLTERGTVLRVAARTRPGADSASAARELRRRLHHALLDAGIALAAPRQP